MCMNDNTFSVPHQIGILGGTFQPIHLGHMDMALSALSVLNLDEVLLMPDRIPPHKDLPEGATDAQRLEMIRLSAQKYNGLTVSDMELMRPGKSYTADTLEYFAKQYPDDALFFILGTDMFLTIQDWYQPERIFRAATLAVVARGYDDAPLIRQQKNRLTEAGARVMIVPSEPLVVSSTQLRARMNAPDLRNYLPIKVREYIMREHLYGTK